ncbi:uncharacterized protein MEPE_03115 [Melanopsichium pennsylvanicum]|uniref:RanBD1 domain-containing protein n=2 Tax=Melanopsichium pennsylvanicum TaxID=63383 RepID=A0AAJ5C562_9BASI|nr:putative protein [Melanopsichium pennsylvanicum 4]SNX84406.1 uncharacterized protein MEPE_03115 [Melanopsichium pennsylvanicum]
MGPSRHTRAAGAPSSSSRKGEDVSTSALTTIAASASRTPTRASPYAKTPTKSSSSALTLAPYTPTSRTNSPMMLREIFSIISPFRGLSKARRSAAFGSSGESDAEEEQSNRSLAAPQTSTLEDVEEAVDSEDRMIEDAEEGVSAADVPASFQPSQHELLDVPSSVRRNTRSPSPIPRSTMPAPPRSLPLADNALVTPGLRRQFANAKADATPATSGPSAAYRPPTQTSPVSRNYDLLARFFSEKQRGGQGGLTEVEVEGCIRLIEESMTSGRNLESEFIGSSSAQQRHFASSSRASSIAPPAMPSSQSTNNLFHPGTSQMHASSSAYSFLAPRAPASQSSFGGSTSSARRRPIYLGPGMSGLSLNRRRPVVASASRAAALVRTQAQGGFMQRSSTDPNLARYGRDADDEQNASDRAEEGKRRRTAADFASPAQGRLSAAEQTVQFEPAYEKQARQSSALAKNIATIASTNGASESPLKRAAPDAESAGPMTAKASPPKTRTASAIQDILKTTPPVRPATKPELVNPYQSAASLTAKGKKADDEATERPVRRSARSSMLTRAKARESAKAAEKNSPPRKESVLDLIERTAPKTSKRKPDAPEPQHNGKTAATEPAATPAPAAAEPFEAERKLQKTEEVQRRLEALTKAKQDQQQTAPNPAVTVEKKASVSLVPPQYTATKPKKPSPLSAAFQAPDSPSSDSEASATVPQLRGPTLAQPSFDFGGPASAKVTAPSSGFSFSAPKLSAAAPASAPAAAVSSSGFSFSKPVASAAPSTSAPSPALSSGFSFTPVGSAPAPSKPSATSASSVGFSFSAPKPAPTAPAAGPTTSTSAVSSIRAPQPSSPRSEVLTEDVSKLPEFEFKAPAVSTSTYGDKALRDEISSVAQAALPQFEFIYDIDTSAAEEKKQTQTWDRAAASAKALASSCSGGFSFSAARPGQETSDAGTGFSLSVPKVTQPNAFANTGFSLSASPAPAVPSSAANTAVIEESSTEDTSSSDDPSKAQSSGLLGEGEGEESESTLFEVRAKIWRLDMETKLWKDLGVCIAKIKHDSATGKHRLLARNEANGKVAVNFMAYKGLKTMLDKTVNSFLGFDGQEPMQLRIKVKTEDMAKEFKDKIEDAGAKV